jgi:signal peptidase I
MERNLVIKELINWTMQIALTIGITLLIVCYVGQFTIVRGDSMYPTLEDNNIMVIEKLTQRFGSLKQGDIVVLKVPELLDNDKTYVVKRIIALEGQRIKIQDGHVYVDGARLEENYTNGNNTHTVPGFYDDMTVPEGCVYVLGDNRLPGASRDSRNYGAVKLNRVAGRVVFRLLPIRKFGPVGLDRSSS